MTPAPAADIIIKNRQRRGQLLRCLSLMGLLACAAIPQFFFSYKYNNVNNNPQLQYKYEESRQRPEAKGEEEEAQQQQQQQLERDAVHVQQQQRQQEEQEQHPSPAQKKSNKILSPKELELLREQQEQEPQQQPTNDNNDNGNIDKGSNNNGNHNGNNNNNNNNNIGSGSAPRNNNSTRTTGAAGEGEGDEGTIENNKNNNNNNCDAVLSESNLADDIRRDKDDGRQRSFAACLIWMDDNSRLVEWIAYNYVVLPLRDLVVYVDPKSTQDPTPILNRWKYLMNVTKWTKPEDFMDDEALKNLTEIDSSDDVARAVLAEILDNSKNGTRSRASYLYSQREFYRSCGAYHRASGRTWTLFADTDEFLTVQPSVLSEDAADRMKRHGTAWDLIAESHGNKKRRIRIRNNATTAAAADEDDDGEEAEERDRLEEDCIVLGRYLFLSYDDPRKNLTKIYRPTSSNSSSSSNNNSGGNVRLPSFLDPYRFQTLRYRYARTSSKRGKSIVDVSKFDIGDRSKYPRLSQHSFIVEEGGGGPCENRGNRARGSEKDKMHFNHYLGSLEAYERPNDSRVGGVYERPNDSRVGGVLYKYGRTEHWYDMNLNWKRRSKYLSSDDDVIGLWLVGFFERFRHDDDKIRCLLADVGHQFDKRTSVSRRQIMSQHARFIETLAAAATTTITTAAATTTDEGKTQ